MMFRQIKLEKDENMKKLFSFVLAIVMILSVAVTMTSARNYDVSWEDVTDSMGLNIYIGEETDDSPSVDGVVYVDEYSYSCYNDTGEIYGYGTGEIQSGVTEYFAHDADYVYYAVEFVQANDNRAFQWQFRPFNTFDVYRDDSDWTKFYYSRVMWQARYMTSGWTDCYSPSIFNNCVSVPLIDYDLICVAGKTYTNLKTYEVAISKEYLAKVNECDVEDIRVVPYITYFHSNAGIGHIYTQGDIDTISDNGGTVSFDTGVGELGYRFIVLDNGPEGENIPSIDVPTIQPDDIPGGSNNQNPSGGNEDKVTLTAKLSMTTLYLVPGAEYTLEVLNSYDVYKWSSSNPCVLIADVEDGCCFIADSYGTSIITATSLRTGEVLECTVYVVDSAINFEWFERDEKNKTLTLELDKYQTMFCFADVIVTFGDIDYVITTDKAGKRPIDAEEAIKLKVGKNVYYIHVTDGDGESVVYKATIVRPRTEATKNDDDDDDRKSKKKGGCFGSISASMLIVIPALAGGVIIAKKRKED